MINLRTKYIFVLSIISILIIAEPALATESEVESVNWWQVVKEGLEFFANILEDSADIVRDGGDMLKELMSE